MALQVALTVPPTVEVPAGTFAMGSEPVALSTQAARSVGDEWRQFDRDEAPVHVVTLPYAFRMGVTEVTNAQYEQYDPAHRALRGRQGFSNGDDEAVVFVSWDDAMGYCRWLSERTGETWRLPTEAEWEYACRAGTTTAYSYGDTLPEGLLKLNYEGVHNDHVFRPVDLTVASGAAPNAFGLYDMHGNVEEWCLDDYAPYPGGPELLSPSERGCYKVTRGGSHTTDPRFLRSAARSAAIPEDRSCLIGFRVVRSEATGPAAACAEGLRPSSHPASSAAQITCPLRLSSPSCCRQQPDCQRPTSIPNNNALPLFAKPIPYVLPAPEGVVSYHHNHEPALAWTPDGALLAIWFSCANENGREMVILSARLEPGAGEWSAPAPFFTVPDRNLTGCSLYQDETTGALIHLGGVEASGWWRNLAIVRRFSCDGGRTWTRPELVNPNHDVGNQLVAGMSRTADGTLIQVCDADPGGVAGSVIHISRDGGRTWERRGDPDNFDFAEGGTGPNIAGIHAGVVELRDGRLMAFGRGVKIPDAAGIDRMPVSCSADLGATWTYHASPFPPIRSGQRLVLMRLREGPILLVSFDNEPPAEPGGAEDAARGAGKNVAGEGAPNSALPSAVARPESVDRVSKAAGSRPEGAEATGADTRPAGMFASLSYDEGATWTAPKLLTDGSGLTLEGGAWTGTFTLDATHAEPKGYLAATQTPDGTIHLLSSRLHYRFNLAWLER